MILTLTLQPFAEMQAFFSCAKEREKIKNYSIIYADPPWQYQRSKVQGAAENHYPDMAIKELCALPVAELAAPDSVSGIIVPITNVMNDQYCYQTSKKIRQVFDYKRRNGQYIGSFAPYGYIKNTKDKCHLDGV